MGTHAVIARCFFCHQPFTANTTVEGFPVARRVAFDPARGRLWAVCASCRRWSLAPIEERWEVLEELERLARDRGRLRSATEHISLLHAGDADLVRVGPRVGLREESHWRYAREYAARRRRAELVETTGEVLDTIATGVTALVSLALIGVPLDPDPDPEKWLRWLRLRRFGRRAWAGDAACAACGEPLPAAGLEERGSFELELAAGEPALRRLCPACGDTPRSGALLDPLAAGHTLRRVLAYENYGGATRESIGDAVELLESEGSGDAFLERTMRLRLRLGRIPPRLSVALEISLSERDERALLALEAAALERRWRDEEELAQIVDGELTPLPGAAADSLTRNR